MRRSILALVVLVLASLGAWWALREPPRAAAPAPAAAAVEPPIAQAAPRRHLLDEAPERARRLQDGAARRDAMQRQIVAAMAARQAAATTPPPDAPDPSPSGPRRARADEPAAEPGADAIVDRTGNHAYLTRVLGQELMPLVDECHALAREAHPDLAGMLVLDLEILGDEDIGGVVNSLDPGQGNEIVEPALLECVRESLLATTLPPPAQGGRDAVALSMRFDPPAPE